MTSDADSRFPSWSRSHVRVRVRVWIVQSSVYHTPDIVRRTYNSTSTSKPASHWLQERPHQVVPLSNSYVIGRTSTHPSPSVPENKTTVAHHDAQTRAAPNSNVYVCVHRRRRFGGSKERRQTYTPRASRAAGSFSAFFLRCVYVRLS